MGTLEALVDARIQALNTVIMRRLLALSPASRWQPHLREILADDINNSIIIRWERPLHAAKKASQDKKSEFLYP